jgi:hypothetical protein
VSPAPIGGASIDHAAAVRERGFTVIEGLVSSAVIARISASIRQQWTRLGNPSLYSREDRWLEPGVFVSPVGMTCAGVLGRVPEVEAVLLEPALLSVFEGLLGPGFELELGAAVMSDETRPFFFWHHHIASIDARERRGQPFPRFDQAQRLVCTLYCTPLDADHGTMLVWPRSVTDSTAPPFESRTEPWPGALTIHAPAGSVVIFDQGTWHAVTPMAQPGQRFFIGFFIRRPGLAAASVADDSLAPAFARTPALARAYALAAAPELRP